MARKKGRLVDCSVECARSGRHDFNVFPKKGETDREACLRRAKDFSAAVDDCGVLRARGINGVGKAGTADPSAIRFKGRMGSPMSDDITAAAARAHRACSITVNEDCREACRLGVRALESQLKKGETKKIFLDGTKPGHIIRET